MASNSEFIDWNLRLRNLFEDGIRGRWFPLASTSPYGRGDTFERLIGKVRDNAATPDFGDIEVKASEANGGSAITLFTKTPKGSRFLRENYGLEELGYNNLPYKSLRTSFTSKGFTDSEKYAFDFTVATDYSASKVKIVVRDKQGQTLSDGDVYWDFNELENAVVQKLSRIAVIEYELDEHHPGMVRYNSLALSEGLTFPRFLKALEAGDMQVDFRLGQYATGKSAGKLHDHGAAFRMSPAKFRKWSDGNGAVTMRDAFTPHVIPTAPRITPAEIAARISAPSAPQRSSSGANICWGCGRVLTDPKSIARGYGPSCAPRAA